jgi:tRNA G37 N-methylase Trm5
MRPEYKRRLLRRPDREDALVRRDVFVRLEPRALEMLRQALERGLKPSGFDVAGDIAILRLERNESRKPLQEE